MKNTLFIILLFFLALPSVLYSQDTGSGLEFLNIGPTPGILSISEAATSQTSGAAAIYTNPALLAIQHQSTIDAAYTLWIANVNNQFAGVNFLRDQSAIAFSVYHSSSGGFEARDRPGPPAGDFSIGYLSLSGAYSQKFGNFSVGISAQYLREEVFQYRSSGYAFTAGASLSLAEERIRIGTALRNLGSMESLDNQPSELPASFNIGFSANLLEINSPGRNDFPMTFTLIGDWQRFIAERYQADYTSTDLENNFYSIALSMLAGDIFVAEAGYRFGNTERPFSTGLSLLVDPIRVNYAFVPFSTGFGSVHSFGVQYFF